MRKYDEEFKREAAAEDLRWAECGERVAEARGFGEPAAWFEEGVF